MWQVEAKRLRLASFICQSWSRVTISALARASTTKARLGADIPKDIFAARRGSLGSSRFPKEI